MAPLSLRIVQDGGTVTKKVKLEPTMTVREAHKIVREKTNVKDNEETYGLFLRSPENEFSGVWMEEQRTLSYYMLREGDRVDYMSKIRNLRIKMLDDSVKTMQVDQSKLVADLMLQICGRLGITNHAEYGLCLEKEEEPEESKDRGAGHTGTLTLKKKTQIKDRDLQFEQLSKKLKTDDNVEWIDAHKTLSEACISPQRTVVLMRKLFYSDRNVDERDPVSLNLLYVQARDDILSARHPVTEDQAADCKIRWINIRDVHRRILRRSQGNRARAPRAYKYDKLLAFMRDFYKEVITTGFNDDNEPEEDDTTETWDDRIHISVSESLLPDNNDSETEEEKPLVKQKRIRKAKKQKNLMIDKFEEVDVSASTANVTSYETDYDVSDPVDSFLISIGATLKKFSPYHLNLAKSKIFHIVQEHDLQQIVEKQQGRLDSVSTSSADPSYYHGL